MTRKLTLGTDSDDRKNIPLHSGCYAYFAAALAGVARHSKIGNDKHNPGEPLHHSRGKSADHADCIARHLMDIADMRARKVVHTTEETAALLTEANAALLTEANALAWRALALSQELHEQFGGAPLAPGAKLPPLPPPPDVLDLPKAPPAPGAKLPKPAALNLPKAPPALKFKVGDEVYFLVDNFKSSRYTGTVIGLTGRENGPYIIRWHIKGGDSVQYGDQPEGRLCWAPFELNEG
jgi:hypothetical protein